MAGSDVNPPVVISLSEARVNPALVNDLIQVLRTIPAKAPVHLRLQPQRSGPKGLLFNLDQFTVSADHLILRRREAPAGSHRARRMMPETDLTLVTGPARVCPACGGEVLAVLEVPHGWATEQGKQVRGTSEVLLCERCDREDPVTGPIVVFFTVHEQATTEHAGELAALLQRWADHATERRPDLKALDAEVEAWRRGEL